MIDWTIKENQKRFQKALSDAYTDYDRLEIFMSYEMDKPLPEITQEAALDIVVFKVMRWAIKEERIDELFQEFCDENPRLKDAVIANLQSQPLIRRSIQLSKQGWTELFTEFVPDDSVYLQIAVRQAFKATYGQDFREIRVDCPSLNTLNEIQDLLTSYDKPVLAVRFVEFAIEEFARSQDTHTRDLTRLKGWRDRIAQQFNVPNPAPKLNQIPNAHAYLMVTLEELGAQVIVYPELHISGKDLPIDFGATPDKSDFNSVGTVLSKWIQMAEKTIAAEGVDEAEVTLEVFLPCRYLEEEIETTWRICDRRGSEFEFGVHRRFVVRSFDRIDHQPTQQSLKNTWSQLQICVKDDDACRQFHTQAKCPEKPGTLRAVLNDKQATGLKFVAAFPQDSSQRKGLLYEIIDAGIPIALWSSEQMDADSNMIEAEFNDFLSKSQVTNFADLARQWREKRRNSRLSTSMRLLCDRPDRVPKLPDPSQEDDLLVAS